MNDFIVKLVNIVFGDYYTLKNDKWHYNVDGVWFYLTMEEMQDCLLDAIGNHIVWLKLMFKRWIMNVKFFCNSGMNLLEYQVNEWIELNEVEVINISFCTEKYGYSTTYYCSVLYK